MLNNAEFPIPASLDVLIQAKIDALPPDLKQVIQVAAVLGAPFDVDILSAVCDSTDIETALDHLASRRFVSKMHDNGLWTFHHPRIEEMAYQSILSIRRQGYHQTVAEILEARWAGSEKEHSEVLAYHLSRANQFDRALTYLITAGEHAVKRSENEQAITYFVQAAKILGTISGTTDVLRWRLATGLGDVYRTMGRYSDSMAALRVGMAMMETGRLDPVMRAGLYRRMGDTTRKQGDYQTAKNYFQAAALILENPETAEQQTELARILTGTAWVQFYQGRFDQAREIAQQGLAYAEAVESTADIAALENLLGGVAYNQSDWASSIQHTQRAMVLREQMGFTSGVASTLGNLGVLAVLEGDWQKAHSFFSNSLSMREDLDVEGLALVHNNMGMLLCDQGDLDQAEKHFRDSLDASSPFPHSHHTANATLGLAYVLFLKNNHDAAYEILSQALNLAQEIGANDVVTEAQRVYVEMLIAEGEIIPALDIAQSTLKKAQDNGNRNHQVSLWRLISAIELAQGHIEVASEALEQGWEILASTTNRLELGRMHVQAACIAMVSGDHVTADTHLKTARITFNELGAELDLTHCYQLAEEWNPVQKISPV